MEVTWTLRDQASPTLTSTSMHIANSPEASLLLLINHWTAFQLIRQTSNCTSIWCNRSLEQPGARSDALATTNTRIIFNKSTVPTSRTNFTINALPINSIPLQTWTLAATSGSHRRWALTELHLKMTPIIVTGKSCSQGSIWIIHQVAWPTRIPHPCSSMMSPRNRSFSWRRRWASWAKTKRCWPSKLRCSSSN